MRMKVSQFPLNTAKETPADAEIASHQLMMRAGMIRKIAAGIYSWQPLGLRVLRKAEAVVREEMNRAGALELLMPAVQPAELWQESGRWEQYGPELLRISDRHQREFCFGPTHEEVITDLARREIRSYKQLPVNFYQIQTKFRDEIRPRFGVMRAREFLMKDAYSFHLDQTSLAETYRVMYDAYTRIFTRLGLDFRAVRADSGAIGGALSHEFHVLADSGEDAIVFSTASDYAANLELAEALAPQGDRPAPGAQTQRVDTPGKHTIEDVSQALGVAPEHCIKTLLVEGSDGGVVALCLRGDHTLNTVKAEKLRQVAAPLSFASDAQVQAVAGCAPGSLGPVGLDIPVIADRAAAHLADFVCGANEDGKHLTGVNWGRDCAEPLVVDISRAMEASVLDETGKEIVMTMGCYGIGVSRVVAAAIEQHHDEQGIIWPAALAPFQVALLGMNQKKSQRVREACEELYRELQDAGIEVIFDDRDVRPGVMFADMELIGIPHRVVIGEKNLDQGLVEYKARRGGENRTIAGDEIVAFLRDQLG